MMLINPDKFTAIVILKGLEDIKLFNIKDESFFTYFFFLFQLMIFFSALLKAANLEHPKIRSFRS